MSTMESEYVAASKCVLSIRFLHKFLEFMELSRGGPTHVHEDNSACIAITSKPVHRSRSKHIGVKYHNVRDANENGEVELVQVWTEHQVADLFTKSLNTKTFTRLRETLMGYVPFDEMVKNHPKPAAKSADVKQVRYVTNPREGSLPNVTVICQESH